MNFHLRTFASGSPDVPEPKQGAGVVHPTGPGVPRLSSRAIFAGVTEVEIEHNGVLYIREIDPDEVSKQNTHN